jgi:adhesin/invasin
MATSWLHGTGKWITALVTTLAAVAALLVNAQNLGLGAWLGSHGLGFADYAASRIVLMPRVDSLTALDDTLALAATVTDRRGAALVGANIRWQSEDSGVATVDSTGMVVARGPGVTRVAASIRQLTAASRVIVHQHVDRVMIGGDTAIRVPERERVPLAAAAVDARGHRIPDKTPVWSSSNASVASVDSEATLTARAPGRAILTAAVGEHTAQATVEVILAPAGVMLESGGGQRLPAGRKLLQAVTVRVLSSGGRPVPNTLVTFRAQDPDGAAEPAQAVTDGAGRARVGWTLSPRPGRQWLSVGVEGLDTVLTVGAEADPVPRNIKVEPSGPPLSGRVATLLGDPALIRVTDSSGVAVVDVPVTWSALDDGKIEPLADRTDSLGEARARWTLGRKAGKQRVRVQVGNPRTMPPLVIAATVAAGPPAALRVAGGDNQRGPAGKPLLKKAVLVATDQLGNPVSGLVVRARPGDGSVTDSVLSTDSTGAVRLGWTLGRRAGPQRLELRAAGVDSVAVVTARASALGAANLAFQNAPATAPPGRALTVTVLVTDAYGNPVADAPVTYTTATGALSVARVMTDDAGRASTRWTPAAAPAEQVLTAVVRGTTVRATHTVRIRR